MSLASDNQKMRRIPRQERAAKRVDALLDAAGDVIAERGFDAATMTAIAERAGTSIGAVYQYFPNKDALVFALRTRYGDEMEAQWSALGDAAQDCSVDELVDRIFALMTDFMASRPAYLPLLSVTLNFRRDAAARNRLRGRFAESFQRYNPALADADAFRVAEVALQVVKSLNPLYAAAKPKERKALVDEYKLAVSSYLATRLG
ncbi:TetR/AcrR family transcriptional regulator [Paraburkholderia phymatum]|uniref:Transcriptional regulator, TetR family n=1 Tax=Paraburkholderia phymatum (strain DSM 17167 / CIP 108236 / LMG 21445 / STM815) TaxID=391038 RepID=B2JDV9_PARP8|nr:TetR/AcrR family transcriptional regulator [Paraburkholderia phymatum]ACC69735.1 transcriptional regulator, TetR family [Paraburkholderia phymatum STM815]